MTIVYVDIGEARKLYGSVAALSIAGRRACVIRPKRDLSSIKPSCIEVEIGIDSKTKRVKVQTIEVPKEVLQTETKLSCSAKQFLSVVQSLDPEVLIAGNNYWLVAKSAAKKLDIPLLLWAPALGIFKLYLLLRDNRLYSRLLTTPLGSVQVMCMARLSSYVITNDTRAARVMKRLGIRNVETIWPTYARFVKKDAYAEFLPRDHVQINKLSCSNPYILSLIALDSKTAVYNTELRSLKFVRSVALAMPDTDFVVIGASIEATQNRLDYAAVKNLRLIGFVYDDVQMSELYRNALCVLCPYRIPGFSNRLTEPFFYGKAIVTTTLAKKLLWRFCA